MSIYLFKSEPTAYSIDDLACDVRIDWFGIRNYQSRNTMQQMHIGDIVLFYHSSCAYVGIVGTARVCSIAHIDHTQYIPGHMYYDARATPDRPIWYCVDIEYVSTFQKIIPLSALRDIPALADMHILKK
jgi:predicted RNA-binding protein with PUA-like domain